MNYSSLYAALGLDGEDLTSGDLVVRSPVDGAEMARVRRHDPADLDAAVNRAETAFLEWRSAPAPVRGQLIRLFGEELRSHKEPLGRLVTVGCGKILQ